MKSLGDGGSCTCALAKHKTTGKPFAIKIYNYDVEIQMIRDEIKMMKCFDHDNIIKLISYGSDPIVFRSGKTRNVHYIVLEYAQMGDLFDLVKNAGFFSESTARFFFK